MTHKLNLDLVILHKLYVEERKSTHEIAHMFNCWATTIADHLRKNNIPLRPPKLKVEISKEELANLYLTKKLSTYKIAKKYGCRANVILRRLQEYGIKERPLKPEEIKITKRQLENLYVRKKLPMNKIAKLLDCNTVTVFKKLKQNKVVSRTTSEAMTKYPKSDFSGNQTEKAYILGFRTGDLGVRLDGNLISVGCGTTKKEQLDLIKSLFFRYGPITIAYSKKYSSWNINARLNKSFEFLLQKLKYIPEDILANNGLFWSFVAGYTDAEGNIGIYQNRARLRIGSYDKEILSQMHQKFVNLGIKSTYSLETKKNSRRGQNEDFWRVKISKKESLLMLLNILEKRLKHQKRLRDLEAARENLLLRIHGKKI
jgi:predicted DNA-binding protein YlxM (UPF0122 family)